MSVEVANEVNYVPGMRIELRDAEWRIDRVDIPTHGGTLLTCTGQSELVRGRTGMFLTELEQSPKILSPETTLLEDDLSAGYSATQLYIDALLQSAPPNDDERISLGHEAAMDLLPYQLDPALQALKQTRPRILIADAVGLGKTLGAGILMTELIRRHRGKRILVLAVKSMLSQFQREMWQRFTIPLVRLDSVGLQRMRNTIPSNHNPFHYIDRAIISIDTLKQSLEYRQYLENCHWDIVVIDEAHNVARRGNRSLRHELAELLCTQCDAMIMLSATPHDGKPESFASLIHMLDPTAIADASSYAHEDYRDKGLVIRRFKKDVAQQLANTLPERVVHPMSTPASALENEAFERVRHSSFKTLSKGSGGAGHLLRTTLEKAMLSSPQACLSTIDNRLNRLDKRNRDADVEHDIDVLSDIKVAIVALTESGKAFSKMQLLIDLLTPGTDQSIGWQPKDPMDRIVLFTESVVTLEYLYDQLPKALKLKTSGKQAQCAMLHGSMKDIELIDTVNAFNRPDDSLRLLLCSDVASEGLNLHHCSHRLIHFDIPWSLMVFQQRNGRVDRYGQTYQPEIYYLMAEAADEDVRGDQRVLEILIEKDTMASQNLGDPSEFMGGASVEDQEAMTAAALESDSSAEDYSSLLDQLLSSATNGLDAFEADGTPTVQADLPDVVAQSASVYPNSKAFLRAGLQWLEGSGRQLTWSESKGVIDLTAPADLERLSKRLPREAIPEGNRFLLTDDKARIMADMEHARDADEPSFGDLHYLWPQHPVLGWMRQRVQDAFGRHAAPVMRLPGKLGPNEHWFLAHGGFPNRRGQALIQDQMAVKFVDDRVTDLVPLSECLQLLGIDGSKQPSRSERRDCRELSLYLDDVVSHLQAHLQSKRKAMTAQLQQKVDQELAGLNTLKSKHMAQLELTLGNSGENTTRKQQREEQQRKRIDGHFADYERWLRESVTTEDEPFIQIVAVITGSESEQLP